MSPAAIRQPENRAPGHLIVPPFTWPEVADRPDVEVRCIYAGVVEVRQGVVTGWCQTAVQVALAPRPGGPSYGEAAWFVPADVQRVERGG